MKPTLNVKSETKTVTIRLKDGEYRVTGPDGTEAQAYYTDDREDAIGTAKAVFGTSISIKINRTKQ